MANAFDSVLPTRQPAVAPADRARERSVHISAPLTGARLSVLAL